MMYELQVGRPIIFPNMHNHEIPIIYIFESNSGTWDAGVGGESLHVRMPVHPREDEAVEARQHQGRVLKPHCPTRIMNDRCCLCV